MTERIDKLNALIQGEVATLLEKEADVPPGTLATVTRVQVSDTIEHARVWISVFPSERGPEVLEALQRDIRTLQQGVNRRLVLRTVPKLLLKLDRREDRAKKISDLLDTLPPAA
jgi:ribosome-binding factor A